MEHETFSFLFLQGKMFIDKYWATFSVLCAILLIACLRFNCRIDTEIQNHLQLEALDRIA